MPPSRLIRLPSSLLFFSVVVALLALPSHLRPENFIVDDGYFYPQIARYIVHGQGSTFNGITPTNGYHPLWMLVCMGAASITSASSPLIQILMFVQDVLTCISLVILAGIGKASGKSGAFLGCVPILFLATTLGIWRLLEANLAFFLQLCVLVIAIPIFPNVQRRLKSSRNVILGVLLGLTLLARLDLIFFAAIIVAFEAACRSKPLLARLRSVAIQVFCASLVITPYLVWNEIQFHHLQPISGAIKSTFPHLQHWHLHLFVLPVIGSILLNGLLFFKRERSSFDLLCILSASAAALHLIFTLSFGGLAPWYLTTGYLSVSLSIIWIINFLVSKWPRIAGAESLLGGACFVALIVLASFRLFSNFSYTRLVHHDISFHSSFVAPARVLAIELRHRLPPNSRIFVFDAPGAVAFYSGMAVLPADGLVADYSYNSDLVREGFAGYASQHRIDYFIAPYLPPGQIYDRLFLRGMREGEVQVMYPQAPLTGRNVGLVNLSDHNVIFTSAEINPDLEAVLPSVGVWRIQHDSTIPGA